PVRLPLASWDLLPEDPVPVRLPLASWDLLPEDPVPVRLPLASWDLLPEDPVPVRLPLAFWDLLTASHRGTVPSTGAGHTPGDAVKVVRAWVCRHLVDTYRGISPTAAAALMDAGLILPVLDGLDEMDAADTPGYGSRARQALDVLNAFQRGRAKASLVLTCRSGQYQALEALEAWAQDAARVEIGRISPAQSRPGPPVHPATGGQLSAMAGSAGHT
ncbi:hypothetical protein ABZT45_45695, partial [Streptomyces sp. NPDC005356]